MDLCERWIWACMCDNAAVAITCARGYVRRDM